MSETIQKLRALEKRMFAYQYAMSLIETDEATVAPSGGEEGRGEALEILSSALYDLIAGDDLPRLLHAAEQEDLDEQSAAEVRELRRQNDQLTKVPAAEYAAGTRLMANSRVAWHKAKQANDFSLFAPWLEKLVDNRRRWADYFMPGQDALATWLDQNQEGLTVAETDRFFASLREAIVPLLRRIQSEGTAPRTDFLQGTWPLEKQKELSAYVMEVMHLDPAHCALSETEHPFTQELYNDDVRITTHYYVNDMISNLFSVIHEGGHALYELHVDSALRYTAVTGGSSIGLHESQSRLFENYVGRSREFLSFLWPKLLELFPENLAGVTCEEFYRAVNRVEPSLIRTEADELTYSLHVMVRYELEKQLLNGTLSVSDLPAAWNRLYKEYLGVDVPNDTVGVLQDVHWSQGSFGYFPGYALGTAYAAQMVAQMKQHLDFAGCCAKGDLQPILDYQTEALWKYGKLRTPDVLIRQACGGEFDPSYFVRYLEEKYTDIYQL